MIQKRKRISGLLLAGVMCMGMIAPASAGDYRDLPKSHWAYSAMMEAAGLGMIQGVGNGQIAPASTMSCGQFLTVLTKTFAPEEYEKAVKQGLAWDQAGYAAAQAAGLWKEEDGLSISADGLNNPISRQDAAVLLAHALPEELRNLENSPSMETVFSDWNQMDAVHQQAVACLSDLGLISGKGDGSFGYADPIQRSDGTVMIMGVLKMAEREMDNTSQEVTIRFINSKDGQSILPDQQVEAQVGQSLTQLLWTLDLDELKYYNPDETQYTVQTIHSIGDVYTLYYTPISQTAREQMEALELLRDNRITWEEYEMMDFHLKLLDENARKHQLLFGDTAKRRFANREEAEASMTTITFPVWRISNGAKVSGTASMSIHSAVAEDVKQIFTEIYNDPEQFPIRDVGGYSWRGDTATGEHNCGTAIDINANENYQIREGQILAGSLWEPGSNPYSIGPNSSVVRIFEEHGWSWGGDAWAYDSDASQGYHDYMHFSYMGD